MGAIFSGVWRWVTSTPVLNAFCVFSFFISLATFLTMLRFKKKIRVEFDRRNFRKNLSRLAKDFQRMHDSLQNGVYTKDSLEEIDSVLDEVLVAYSFLPAMIKIRIHIVEFYIQHMCIPDALNGSTRRVHVLCKQLRRIDIYMRKEG